MAHSSRRSYKEKAEMAALHLEALRKARTTIQALEDELDARTERELELLDVVNSLMLTTKHLSATLYASIGDFGVGESFDHNIDADLELCRPALVVARANVVMTHAITRLDELHKGYLDTEQAASEVLAQIESALETGLSARDRRRQLLISGSSGDQGKFDTVPSGASEYVVQADGPSIEQIYEVQNDPRSLAQELIESDQKQELDDLRSLEIQAQFLQSDVRRHVEARRRFGERTGRVIR